MGSPHWKPLSPDLSGPARDLAEQLRFLLDREGWSLRRLAAEDDVPYSLTTLHRFFSGQALPPRSLIEVIARKCGGDLKKLQNAYDRARGAPGKSGRPAETPRESSEPAPTVRELGAFPLPRHTTKRRLSLRNRRTLVGTALVMSVVAVVLLAVVVMNRSDERRPTSPAVAAPPTPSSIPAPTPSLSPEPSPERKPNPGRTSKPGRSDRPRGTTSGRPKPKPKPSRKSTPGPKSYGGGLIKNGTFTGTLAHWWRREPVRIRVERNRLRADVPGGSKEPWDKILGYSNYPLSSGRTYTLEFDASANISRRIRVTAQYEHEPYTKAFQKDLTLGTSTRRYSYRFTSGLSTNLGVLTFQLGGHSDDMVFRLDNVSLRRR